MGRAALHSRGLCGHKDKALFKKHDEYRFSKYLTDVEEGKAKIMAGALLPHEIAAAAMCAKEEDVSELQCHC
ncbi:hypothetical protein E2562_015919 [Oryza meyeriana var. granulata]|uniref:DUF2828 domain-containing protein n=1 Tax=Oryza meyeriana var. granulata TaxID=110450 RepID=A0A6G1CGF6_9ORYZ|nr:hypothetical protein E2562_015919 [Oryza meyeriana var. granulata]